MNAQSGCLALTLYHRGCELWALVPVLVYVSSDRPPSDYLPITECQLPVGRVTTLGVPLVN